MRTILSIIFVFCLSISYCFGQLSDKVKTKVKALAVAEYMESHMDGCSLYKTRYGNILTAAVTVKNKVNPEITQRVAQVKANRLFSDYLSGTKVNANTSYTLTNTETHSYNEIQSDDNDISDNLIDTSTSSVMDENTIQKDEDKFTDRINNRTSGFVRGVNFLKNIQYTDRTVYIYYIQL